MLHFKFAPPMALGVKTSLLARIKHQNCEGYWIVVLTDLNHVTLPMSPEAGLQCSSGGPSQSLCLFKHTVRGRLLEPTLEASA